MTTRTAVAVWTVAIAAAAAVSAVVAGAEQAESPVWTIALTVPTGLAFAASGIVIRTRRPDNSIGLFLVAVGFCSFVGALRTADDSTLFTVGQALQWIYFGFLVHVVLAFPSGRLTSSANRVLAGLAYALGTMMLPTLMLFEAERHHDCVGAACPENLLALAPNEGVAHQLDRVHLWVALAVVAAIVAQVARRWLGTRAALRRAVTPVFASFTALMAVLAVQHVVEASAPGALDAVNWVLLATLLTVPVAFLFGLFRTRFGHAVERLVLELNTLPPGGVRDALSRALRDPSLELAYATGPGVFVDLEGKPVALPGPDDERTAKLVERDGRTIAALVHDDSLTGDPLLESVSAAAGLAIENERLQAELRARLDELRASRARLVQASDDARRRFERNLHDGAQQRLVTLSLALRLAQSALSDDPAAAGQMLAEASEELAHALEELRELARGLHPAILSDRGLDPALEALAARASLPVELDALPNGRLPKPVEIAAFYVISEALANVSKYAQASFARVSVTRADGHAIVEVADDGIGGADVAVGTGLRGLVDRVEALDGRLEIDSEPGRGTRIRAVIPTGDLA